MTDIIGGAELLEDRIKAYLTEMGSVGATASWVLLVQAEKELRLRNLALADTVERCAKIAADAAPGFCGGKAEIVLYTVADSIRALSPTSLEEVRGMREDAARFDYLQNLPAETAQAFFWNYRSRKQRAAAIDEARKK